MYMCTCLSIPRGMHIEKLLLSRVHPGLMHWNQSSGLGPATPLAQVRASAAFDFSTASDHIPEEPDGQTC